MRANTVFKNQKGFFGLLHGMIQIQWHTWQRLSIIISYEASVYTAHF